MTNLSQQLPPALTKVLVIGGGSGGSYAASTLAREGIDVVLLEASIFPRYHIGESMLPSIRPFLKFIGAEQKIINHGFQPKPGAAVKFNQYKREGYSDFIAEGPENGSWNVVRSEFDDILLRHAQECGALVYQGYRVNEIQFFTEDVFRPTAATFTGPRGLFGSITFDYLVDASGRAGIMSTKYLKNRQVNTSLKNIACWGYWSGAKAYSPGTNRENAAYFEALKDESGWAWCIPLHNHTTSIGVVMREDISTLKKRSKGDAGDTYTLKDHYISQLDLVPGLKAMLEDAKLQDDPAKGPPVRSASDYSYSATSYAGDHFRLVGDASAFIDPLFSSGVHLAFMGALTASASIAASIRGQCSENEAVMFHDNSVSTSYTRFLLVVLASYKQICAQNAAVLSDVDEDNFDRAFDMIRPVIQGTADVNKELTEDELQKTMDFLRHVFIPIEPSTQAAVNARMDRNILSVQGPVLTQSQIDQLVGKDAEARLYLQKVNSRRSVKDMYNGPAQLAKEVINGFMPCIQVGSLGLIRMEG